MEMWGADTDQLDALARDLTAAAASLETISRSVGGRIGSTPWAGRDATMFRDDWQHRHAAALRAARETMRAAAAAVTAHAGDQRKASEASGGGAHHDPSTASRILSGVRTGAGVVGDVAEGVQFGANVVAAGAGTVAVVGTLTGNPIALVAAPIAAGAAGVSEVSGLVSIVGHGIENPDDPELAEQVVVQATTGGLIGPTGVAAADAATDGAKGLVTDVLTKMG
jgi:hypothetical protein